METLAQKVVVEKSEDSDSSGKIRRLGNSFWGVVIKLAAIGLSVFHLYTAGFGVLPVINQRSFHLGLVLFLIFLIFPATKNASRLKMSNIDVVIAFIALLANVYVFYRYDLIAANSGITNNLDIIVGGIIIIIVLEACRRTTGNALPIIMIVALAYSYLGPYFPHFLTHSGLSLERIISFMVWSTEGIYGLVLGVSATYLFVFILFGALLSKTGLSDVINDLALSVAGRARGGPAKVAIIASGLMGSISGSAVSNVATTGTLTIPLMRKIGYSRSFAASVEAIASTGGQIMPPVMGAAAFIMAEFLGVSYATIMISAIIPAFLFYFATWIVVDLEARRLGLVGLGRDAIPNFGRLFVKKGYMLLPIGILIYLLLQGRTPLFAVFYTIVFTIIITSFKKESRLTPSRFVESLEDAGKVALPVVSACATVGIMVGVTGATGIGLVLGDGLISLAGGNFYLTLVFIMLTSLVLGMGLPAVACYIVVSTLAAPALISFGIQGIPAHFFVFFFGVLSVLTPPVALASFTAAGISGSSPSKVGWMAFRLCLAGFLIPFMFITAPELLFIDTTIMGVIPKVLTAMIGIFSLGLGLIGYLNAKLNMGFRLILAFAGILLIHGSYFTDLIGISLIVIVIAIIYIKKKTYK